MKTITIETPDGYRRTISADKLKTMEEASQKSIRLAMKAGLSKEEAEFHYSFKIVKENE